MACSHNPYGQSLLQLYADAVVPHPLQDEPRPTAAIPMDSPCCSCKLTRSCHTHFKERVEEVKRGVWMAGGFPVTLPFRIEM